MPRFFSKNISAYLGPIWSLVSPRDEALKNLKKDLKEAQARARRFEGMFQSLARATNHFVWMVDEELRFTYCNSAFKELLGYEPEELLGRKFTEFQPPERVEKDLRAAAQMIQSHSDFDYETELLHRDGTRLSVLANAVTLQDETGRTTGIIGISWNITAHKRLVEVLRRSEYGLARAQKISGIGSWDWDVRTREVNWSDEAYRVFGLDPRGPRIYFDRVLELVHPEDLERLSTAVEEAISGRQPLDIEHRVIWPDQSVHFLHQQGELLLDDDGRPFRMIGAVHDVTLQRAYEAGLVHAKEAADTANRLKSSFLANMSHELRTPLTAILGFTDLLKQSDDATENLKKFQWLETIRRNSKHLLTLIDDVLDLS
jgi:PAS domain S-box-containing protein